MVWECILLAVQQWMSYLEVLFTSCKVSLELGEVSLSVSCTCELPPLPLHLCCLLIQLSPAHTHSMGPHDRHETRLLSQTILSAVHQQPVASKDKDRSGKSTHRDPNFPLHHGAGYHIIAFLQLRCIAPYIMLPQCAWQDQNMLVCIRGIYTTVCMLVCIRVRHSHAPIVALSSMMHAIVAE